MWSRRFLNLCDSLCYRHPQFEDDAFPNHSLPINPNRNKQAISHVSFRQEEASSTGALQQNHSLLVPSELAVWVASEASCRACETSKMPMRHLHVTLARWTGRFHPPEYFRAKRIRTSEIPAPVIVFKVLAWYMWWSNAFIFFFTGFRLHVTSRTPASL